ncbi:glycosyltransferase family 2 protein [Sandaracinobacteroides saxicola]|uniref:Glycosyltransferase n=1 Tax=Sandaracinobacteroides saxicola TaxID=2759707 RepID=A0A7G5IK60_9SPHN|nr:glycosyltransferase family 2 protein [Sandaracinobacteroides saxicola]QMW23752.1 glycosyltransferase [Sandaracinobacteroides saxicola]
MPPKITLITVAWNAAATIADTLRSVAAQTTAPHEHLIVDGASSDTTIALAQQYALPFTRIISEPDKGLYDAMNKGFAAATGDYIGFLNADDFLVRTDAIALLQAAAGAHPEALSAAVVLVKPDAPTVRTRSYSAHHFRPWMLRFGHMPPHPGFYVRRDIATVLGPMRTDLRISADFDFMVRFFARHSAATLAETLVAVREGGASNSGFSSRQTIARENLAVLRAHGIASASALMWAKYAAKIAQYAIPAAHYPAPATVRWEP